MRRIIYPRKKIIPPLLRLMLASETVSNQECCGRDSKGKAPIVVADNSEDENLLSKRRKVEKKKRNGSSIQKRKQERRVPGDLMEESNVEESGIHMHDEVGAF